MNSRYAPMQVIARMRLSSPKRTWRAGHPSSGEDRALNRAYRQQLFLAWLERRGGALDEFVFPSRIDHADHISTRQYARLVDEWVTGIGLHPEDYGTHSLRRTKASIIYKQTGNLRAVQILLVHTKIESTVRYLGVDVEDALALAEGMEV
jgi:site-specific recombinase XerC